MNDNELNRISDLIWTTLKSIENENKSRAEQIELIKPILLNLYSDSINIGRKRILNYIKDEIKHLETQN